MIADAWQKRLQLHIIVEFHRGRCASLIRRMAEVTR
jgi:hypothetical protein